MTTATPFKENGVGESYLRIIALSIAAYDYIITIPAERRFYRNQRWSAPSPGCVLFICIRYLSIATLVVSNVGYFGSFSLSVCSRYYIAAPIFKVLQIMVSQIILGIRTLNIARRSSWAKWVLLALFIIATTLEWFTNLFQRNFEQNSHHNCTAGNNVAHLSTWLFYVVAMGYDVITLCISTWFLLGFRTSSGRMTELVQIMLYDGLGYFVVLTGANIFNLIIYHTSDEATQSSAASLGYALTWIMSQRILIHLREAAEEHHRATHIVTRPLESAHEISHAMRSQFEGKSGLTLDLDLEHAGADREADYTHARPKHHTGDPASPQRDTPSYSGSRPSRPHGLVHSRTAQSQSQFETESEWSRDPLESLFASEPSFVAPRRTGEQSGPVSRVPSERGADGEELDEVSELPRDLRVQVQRSVEVTVEYGATTYDRESYRKPRLAWDPMRSIK
ncbi:hypothetical protein CERSUDRAFT_86212 [Gelatoporia subvermispora B]|uniref:DUF6533 domain-containing protein n=1 Tax=Ceriporiopsis subvermispora (strain B) TaxID=914234 RepID=M2R7X0_CERS8|nr:hypothetical protein CERSUDRAFT_86212 [Gelatoporia subvermispora B]